MPSLPVSITVFQCPFHLLLQYQLLLLLMCEAAAALLILRDLSVPGSRSCICELEKEIEERNPIHCVVQKIDESWEGITMMWIFRPVEEGMICSLPIHCMISSIVDWTPPLKSKLKPPSYCGCKHKTVISAVFLGLNPPSSSILLGFMKVHCCP